MKLAHFYCPREYAVRLKELGIHNSTTMLDPEGSEYQVPKIGCFYSYMVGERYFEGIIGNQEDAPYGIYNPIEHYSLAQLLIAFSSEALAEIFMQYAYDQEDCILVNYIATRLIRALTNVPEMVSEVNEKMKMVVDPTPPRPENPLDNFERKL